MESGWDCTCARKNDYSDRTCSGCGNDKPTSADKDGENENVEPEWSCPVCTFINKGSDDACDICKNTKTEGACGVTTVYLRNGAGQRAPNTAYIGTEELRIVIIGKTGTGKSATGNNILGKSEFESKFCGASVTSKCKLGMNTRFDRTIVVVDTPGLYDTGMTNEQVTKEIIKCIGMTAPGPHAFLLTVNLASRFTEEEKNTVKHFVDHFGVGMYNYLMVVFTRADDLENEGVSINEYVGNAPNSLQAILRLCNNRFVPINNKLTGHRQEQQIQGLISNIDAQVQNNGGYCYTNEMWEEAENTLRRREEEMKRKLQEEERKKVEAIKRDFQAQFDKMYATISQENERLANQIKEREQDRQKDEALAQEMKDKIAALHDQIRDCKMQEENRDREREEKLENMLEDMERRQAHQIQMQNDKANEEIITQLQDQIEKNDRRRQKEIQDLKKDHSKKVDDLEETYKMLWQMNSTDLRDNSRRDVEKEKGPFSKIVDRIGGFVGSAVDKIKQSAAAGNLKGCVIS